MVVTVLVVCCLNYSLFFWEVLVSMKINFKINYQSLTASHYTTFPQTEQSANLLSRKQTKLDDIANETRASISKKATDKLRNSLLGVNIDLFS